MIRDFTYVADIVESIYLLIKKPPKKDISFDKLNPDPSKVGLHLKFLILATQILFILWIMFCFGKCIRYKGNN